MTKSVSISLRLNASPEAAFPMFDPVNETKWDPQWKPQLLGSRVEEGLVFLVGEGKQRTTWLLDRYDPIHHHIAYVVAGPSVLTRIVIGLKPANAGTIANVTYIKTALDEDGNASIDHFVKHFPAEQPHWESAINAALARKSPKTGLRTGAQF